MLSHGFTPSFTGIIRCSRYNEMNRAINKLYERKINYVTMKNKNKKIIPIKDGIVTYKINLNPKLGCQCDAHTGIYCNHILYLLSKIYKLSDLTITFIHLKQVHEQFIKYIIKNRTIDDLNNILEGEIKKYFAEETCGICLLTLDDRKFNYDIYTCDQCNNYVHSKCMDDWMNVKIKTIPDMEKGCIYCRRSN